LSPCSTRQGSLLDDDQHAKVERDLRKVSGNGQNNVRLDYFWMLVGDDQRVKPDTMVRRWVRDVLGLPPLTSAAEARDHGVAAARALGRAPWELDHAIWLHQRRVPRPTGGGKRINTEGCLADAGRPGEDCEVTGEGVIDLSLGGLQVDRIEPELTLSPMSIH
jgi:hypothetical protein